MRFGFGHVNDQLCSHGSSNKTKLLRLSLSTTACQHSAHLQASADQGFGSQASKPVNWFHENPLDLPDERIREAKMCALMQGRTLRDLVADFLRQGPGMATPQAPQSPQPKAIFKSNSP